MITLEESNAIIKHRAAAASYDTISEMTGISKPTVIKVCHEREADIIEARKIAWESSRDDIASFTKKRREMYQNLLKDACNELGKRSVSDMSTRDLISLLRTTEQNLVSLESSNRDYADTHKDLSTYFTKEQLDEFIMEGRASWAYQHPEKYPINVYAGCPNDKEAETE